MTVTSLLNFSRKTSPLMSTTLFSRSFRYRSFPISRISMIFHQSFLLRQELISRGDFVDVDNLECTPKIGKYTVSGRGNALVSDDNEIAYNYNDDDLLTILSRLKTRCSATSITSARPTASLCRNFARFDISVEFVSVPLLPCSGRPCVRHPWKVLQPPTEVWIHELLYYHCPSICASLNRSNLTAFFGPLPKCTKSKMTDVTQSTT